jgi:hypothetical protein
MMDFLSRTPPKAAVAIFFYLLLLYLFMPIRTPLNFYDEGFAVFNPVRVLNGELPYRDFWAIYPPGQLFSLAGVYKILGVSLLASRVYDTWVRFALVIAVFLVARKITTSWLAYSAALVATLMMASVGFYGYAVYPALAWGIFALWCALKFGETGRPRWLVLAGVLMGVSTFFRWDIGLYGVIGLTAALLLRQFIGAWRAGQSFYRSAGSGLKIASWLLLPAGAAILILYGWVSLKSGLGNVWSQVVWFPARQLHDVRWLAYPRLVPAVAKLSDWWDSYSPWMDWLRFYLPLTVYALAIVYLGHAFLIRRIELDNRRFGILAAALFGLLTFAQALSRYDYIHALPTGVFAFLVVVGLVYQALCASKATHLRIAILVLAPGILAVYFASTVNSYLLTMDHWPPWGCYSTFPPASCAYIGENRQRAVEYLQSRTQTHEPVYVGNQRHDMVFVSDVSFYFLAGRPSVTRYSELHPGVTTTRPVQLEIIRELETQQAPFLVLVDIWLSQEPNDSALSSGVTDLDEYIRANYRPAAQFGEFQIWQSIRR